MPANTLDIVSFSGPRPAPSVDHPRPDRLLRGDPVRTTWSYFEHPSQRVFAGEWACETGAWRIEVPDTQIEVCTLISGRVRLTDQQDRSVEFGPGETFVVPAGFVGVWDTLEPLRKIYVITLL